MYQRILRVVGITVTELRRQVRKPRDNHVVCVATALDRIGNFKAFLHEDFDEAFTYAAPRKAETLGRPVGSKH